MWGAHLSRDHAQPQQLSQTVSFSCLVCNLFNCHTERQFLEHIGVHLKKHETVHCVFKDCAYSTNIFSTFASHRSRKHPPHCLEDFKNTVFQTYSDQPTEVSFVEESEIVASEETPVKEGEDLCHR